MTLKAENVSKEFIRAGKGTNRFIAVNCADLTLVPGQLCVVMGRSGSGKTTLLNMLAGILVPTSGRILLGETDIYSLSDKKLSQLRNRNIGYIPQGQTALHSMSVLDNVLVPFMLYNDEPDEKYARELLEKLDIAPLADTSPSELSGGELRRMAIARALVRKPDIVLADEPTADLDDENTAAVFSFLRETAHSGCAVLVVTHDAEAAAYTDRLIEMNKGVITMHNT